MMEYERFTRAVEDLGLFPDQQTVDAAVKAVLGILASRLDEGQARELTDHLPEPLSYDRLRGQQLRTTAISADDLVATLAGQFRVSEEQARTLVRAVLRVAKDALPGEALRDVTDHLPDDWRSILQAA